MPLSGLLRDPQLARRPAGQPPDPVPPQPNLPGGAAIVWWRRREWVLPDGETAAVCTYLVLPLVGVVVAVLATALGFMVDVFRLRRCPEGAPRQGRVASAGALFAAPGVIIIPIVGWLLRQRRRAAPA